MEKKIPFVCPVCGEKISPRNAWFLSVDSVVTCKKCGSRLKPEDHKLQRISLLYSLITTIISFNIIFWGFRLQGPLYGVVYAIILATIAILVYFWLIRKYVHFTCYQ